MRTEHAIIYKHAASIGDISYLVKKANKLGMLGNEITHIYQQQDEEGFHIYFEVKPSNYFPEEYAVKEREV